MLLWQKDNGDEMNNTIESYPGQIKDLEDRVQLIEEIFNGGRLVVPVSIEHAQAMITIGQHYIAMNTSEDVRN